MSYQVHNFQSGDVLLASQLNEMDDQIAENSKDIVALACGTIVDVSTKVDELTSANIAQAILDSLEDSSYIYIPAGDYTFNVTISQDCTIFMDDKCYISTAIQAPCINAENCSISIYGGNAYSGVDDGERYYIGYPAGIPYRGARSIIRLINCHDCTIKGLKSPYHKCWDVIYVSDSRSVVIDACSFDKILNSAIFFDRHCEKVTVKNCTFKNSRYAIDGSGVPRYYCYFVYTGCWSFSEDFEPIDGLIYENNYCYNSEDSGLDTHGARNVIMRNNTVIETVCALTAYNDNRRVRRPAGWCMENILLENNYCKSTKSNDPRTEYRHPFIFLGNANGHTASETDYADNPGNYYDFRNCIVRNNTFISASDIDYALTLNVGALDLVIENNYLEFPNAGFAIGAYQYLLNTRIEGNTYERNRGVAIPNGSSVKIDYGVLNTGANMLREITWTAGLGLYMGQTRGTVVCAGGEIRVTDNRLAQAVGYGKRITGSYTGDTSFTVVVADGVCTTTAVVNGVLTPIKHHLLPGMRVAFTASGSSNQVIKYVKKLLDYECFELYLEALADGEYTMELTSTTFYNTIPSDTFPLMDGTAAVGSSESYARADHVHPTDTSRIAANQGAVNAGKFLVVGNDGVVIPTTAPSGGSEWELVVNFTAEEEVSSATVSFDSTVRGKILAANEISFVSYFVSTTDSTITAKGTFTQKICGNDTWKTFIQPDTNSGNIVPAAGQANNLYRIVHEQKCAPFNWFPNDDGSAPYLRHGGYTNSANPSISASTGWGFDKSTGAYAQEITKAYFLTNTKFGVGTNFRIYVR